MAKQGGKRPARRGQEVPDSKPAPGLVKSGVGLDAETHHGLTTAARKLGRTNTQFAAAAIGYFLDTGIDPTTASGIRDGLVTRQMMSELSQLELGRDDDNANRIISILRSFEQRLYRYHEETEGKIFAYIGAIERNILAHQVGLEEQVFVPMLEWIMRGAIDANMSRKQSEHVRHKGEGGSTEEIRQAHDKYDDQRERRLVGEIRDLLQKYRLPKPATTAQPRLTVPQPVARPSTPEKPSETPQSPGEKPKPDFY